jgi:hypothetical protein
MGSHEAKPAFEMAVTFSMEKSGAPVGPGCHRNLLGLIRASSMIRLSSGPTRIGTKHGSQPLASLPSPTKANIF